MSRRTQSLLQSTEPLAVPPRVAFKMLSVGTTKGYDLLARGELESFVDGHMRRITIASINAYVARRVAETAGQPSRRIQNTKTAAATA